MKVKEICYQYGFKQKQLEYFVMKNGYPYKNGLSGMTVGDSDVEEIVTRFRGEMRQLAREAEEKRLAEEQARKEEEEEANRKKKALAEMLITSGFNFDGYKIIKYSGYISGDDCVTMPRDNFWGTNKVSDNLCGSLVKIRRNAIRELKEAAYALGCNAVIGVDFDYLVMDPQHAAALNNAVTVYEPYVICVTANGNAVIIEEADTDL